MKPQARKVTPDELLDLERAGHLSEAEEVDGGTVTLGGREWTREEYDALMSDDGATLKQEEVAAKPAFEEGGVGAETKLEFRTGEQIAKESAESVEWIARPWVVKGAITEVDGQVKAAGKTTWMTHMCRAVLDGTHFMGQPTRKTPIVYLTEQPQASFRGALELAGLLERKDFSVLFWNRTSGKQWAEIARQSVAQCKAIGAELLVVDTIAQFAGLVGDRENHSGDALLSMQPLMDGTGEGLGIVVVRHERKKGGQVGSSGRGSSAFSGAVDIVLSIRRPEGNSRPTVREIHAISRFEETPGMCVVELTAKGYVVLGKAKDAVKQEDQAKILAAVPESAGNAIPLTTMCKQTGLRRSSTQRHIEQLLGEGKLDLIGKGTRSDPFRYCKKTSAQ
jgi:hypothetical protein